MRFACYRVRSIAGMTCIFIYCRGTLERLVLPSSLRPDVQERSGATSAAARDALRCHVLGKRDRGYDAWYGRSVMPCVCMLMGCLKGP